MSTSSASAEPATDALARLRIERAQPRQRSFWSRWWVKAFLMLIVLLGIGAGGVALAVKNGWVVLNKNWLPVPEMMQSRPEVRLASVTVETGRSAEALVVATGYLESRRQAKIGARAPGRIELVNVEEGSRVETGQVLAVLEHADLEASLAAVMASLLRAQAALAEQEIAIAQSQREFERAERQWKSKTISDSEYDEKKFKHDGNVARRASLAAEIALAEARVREAEQMKENMFIKAPFNGTVISKDAEVGESILPGGMGEASGRGSAVTVADLEHLEVECDVKEDYISRVIPGQTAEVAVDAVPKFRYQGKVRKIIPMGDRARATIKVKVEIINVDARLFPNMSATVYFLPAETAEATQAATRRVFCDTAAIRADDASRFVWIADEQDRIRRQDVSTGSERDKRTEITQGLSGGERVVITPPGLESGQLVKILR
ncbi:MAG: efflux RND transporter periplasmic adaptor subunit [Planctomycetaceae bacterium]|nr:efflux RND transporter periplasmic adaptor subunit [Planctomycetaceae bacterium]